MHWWDEAEARALRSRTPETVAQTYSQRMIAAGVHPDLVALPAYDLAILLFLCSDYIKLVDALLTEADGDGAAIRRHGQRLYRWCQQAHQFTTMSATAFNQMIDRLELDAGALAARTDVVPPSDDGDPAEVGKVDGRFTRWHLLYERVELKLATVGIEEAMRRPLARTCARVFEQAIITSRQLSTLERDNQISNGRLSRLLLDLNTTWHFDLGPFLLGPGELRIQGPGGPGFMTWLLLAFSA